MQAIVVTVATRPLLPRQTFILLQEKAKFETPKYIIYTDSCSNAIEFVCWSQLGHTLVWNFKTYPTATFVLQNMQAISLYCRN